MKQSLLLLAVCLFPLILPAQTAKVPIDYLQVPGPIFFEKTAYQLSWSSHPTDTFYKHEYIAKGDDPLRFKTMILVDLLMDSGTVKDVIGAKVAELKKLKETNPLVSYQVTAMPKTGEFLLDFLLSQAAPNGKSLSIVERNVYRYKQLTDPSGKSILLFGVSQRGYGADTGPFLTSLKQTKADLPAKVEQFPIPIASIVRQL